MPWYDIASIIFGRNETTGLSEQIDKTSDARNALKVQTELSQPLTDAQLRATPPAVAVTNLPATQTVAGSVAVTNLPATQTVAGSVAVTNFPAVQPVSGPLTADDIKGARDIFGRMAVSRPENQVEVPFDNANWATFVNVTRSGGASAPTQANGQVTVASGTGANGACDVVSLDAVNYRPGHEIGWGGTWKIGSTAGAASSYVRVGPHDASWANGVWIGTEGTTFGLTYSRNGTIIWTKPPSLWLDKCDGTAGSKYTSGGVPVAMDPTLDQLIRVRAGLFGHKGFVVELCAPDSNADGTTKWVKIYEFTGINGLNVPVFSNFDLNLGMGVNKVGSDATNLSVTSSCWTGWTGTGKSRLSVLPTQRTLAEYVQAIMVGQTPSGGYAQLLLNAAGRLQLITQVQNVAGATINPATEDTLALLNGKDFATQATLAAASAKLDTIDSGELDGLTPKTSYITTATTTTVHTPAAGKKIELRWIYALNSPSATTPARITISLGAVTLFDTFGISKRLKFSGAVGDTLTVVTDSAGPVCVSAMLREI